MISKEIDDYVFRWSESRSPELDEIDRNTHLYTLSPGMLSGGIQGAFLTMFVSLTNARNILEIGTFTGYGAICLAKGIPLNEPGSVTTLEGNHEYHHLIEKNIESIGLKERIRVLYGDAIKTLQTLPDTWDLVYIDANKREYKQYYDLIIDKVRPGGWILSDNVLWKGKVINPTGDTDATLIHEYNKMLKEDDRVEVLILPIRDGLSLARKK